MRVIMGFREELKWVMSMGAIEDSNILFRSKRYTYDGVLCVNQSVFIQS